MYYITLETTENGQKTTYSDRLLDMQLKKDFENSDN